VSDFGGSGLRNRVKARASLGERGKVWVEIERGFGGGPIGAHLAKIEAIELAGLLLLAVEQINEEQS
jgi:hypothetical protein